MGVGFFLEEAVTPLEQIPAMRKAASKRSTTGAQVIVNTQTITEMEHLGAAADHGRR